MLAEEIQNATMRKLHSQVVRAQAADAVFHETCEKCMFRLDNSYKECGNSASLDQLCRLLSCPL